MRLNKKIVNEFLKKIEEKEANIIDEFLSDNETEEDDSCGFASEKRLERESDEHSKMIGSIETKNFVPMKNAMMKDYIWNKLVMIGHRGMLKVIHTVKTGQVGGGLF